jgi:hypothetical protein
VPAAGWRAACRCALNVMFVVLGWHEGLESGPSSTAPPPPTHTCARTAGTPLPAAAGHTPPWAKSQRAREALSGARAYVKTLVQDGTLNPRCVCVLRAVELLLCAHHCREAAVFSMCQRHPKRQQLTLSLQSARSHV